MGYHPWGHKQSDTTDRLTHTQTGRVQRKTDRGGMIPCLFQGTLNSHSFRKQLGSASFFLKGQTVKSSVLQVLKESGVGPVAAGGQTQTTQEWAWLCSHRLPLTK